MASDRGVLLLPAFQKHYVPNQIDGFRMTITASQPRDMPSKIFRYREIPIQPGQAARLGHFAGVCSPADLEEYPEDAPHTNADPPMYRLAAVDMVFRSRAEAEAAWADIQSEVEILVATLNTMDVLEAAAPVWVGGGDAPVDSSSSLSSGSSGV